MARSSGGNGIDNESLQDGFRHYVETSCQIWEKFENRMISKTRVLNARMDRIKLASQFLQAKTRVLDKDSAGS